MGKSQAHGREASIGSLLVPDRLASWAWLLGYAALICSALLTFRLPQLHSVLLSLEHRAGVPVGAYVLAAMDREFGAGPVFLVQALAIGAGYLLALRIVESSGAKQRIGHVIGIASLASPVALQLALGPIQPELLLLAGTMGLALAARHNNWALFAAAGFILLLFSNLAPLVLFLAAIPLWAERQLPAASAAIIGALVIAPILHLVLGDVQLQAGLTTLLLAELPIHIADPRALIDWTATSRAWVDVVWLLGPFAVLLAVGGRKVLNTWWLPALILLVLQLAQGRGAFGPAGYASAAFVFIASAVGAAAVKSEGRRLRVLLFANPILVAAAFLIINRHTLL